MNRLGCMVMACLLILGSVAQAAILAGYDSVAYWTLDDGVALDSSGNGHDGTVAGATEVDGFNESCLAFNGQDGIVEVPAAAFTNVDDQITIGFWSVAGDDQPIQDSIFYAENAAGDTILNIHLPWTDGDVYWDAGNDGSGWDRINTAAPDSNLLTAWNHWVFTKDTTTGEMAIYLNGALHHSETGMTNSLAGIAAASIGAQLDTLHYSGLIDEVVLFDRALSAEEITDLYNIYFADVLTLNTEIDGETARYQVYIPDSVEEVKAAFYISQHGQGTITHEVLQQFAEEESLALVGFFGAAIQRGPLPAIGEGDVSVEDEHLAILAQMCGHPELPDVPFMTFGHSNGTGHAGAWPRDRTDQAICWIAFHPGFTAYLQFDNTEQVPAMVMLGAVDSYFERSRQDLVVQTMRSTRNAAMCALVEGGMGHGMPDADDTWTLIVEFCKAAMRIRLNEDGSLNPVDIESGWLGDIYDVTVGGTDTLDGGRQELDIFPFSEYGGDASIANWFPDERFARCWQLYGMTEAGGFLDVLPLLDDSDPVAESQTVAVSEGDSIAITLSGSDLDGDSLSFRVVTQPAHGTLSGSAPNLIYTPDADYNGPDSFTFVANDGTVDSDVATVDILVGFDGGDDIIDQTASSRVDDRDSNGLGDADASNGLVGFHTNVDNMHQVYVFQMTGIADPSQITGADFSVTLASIVGTVDFNVDAHIIRTSTNSTVLVSDYETTAGTLMEDFVTTSSATNSYSLDTAGESALVTYLQNNWVDGDYVFIGLKTDPLTLSGASSKYYVFDPDAQLSVSSSAAPVYGEQLIGWDDFDGDSEYESRTINNGINNGNNLWGIVNRDTVVTDEVIDTSVAAGGVVAYDAADTLGFLGTNKTDNVFGMYRAGASRTLVYTFDVSGVQDLKMEMDWICSGDMADKNVSVSCSMDGGATQTVFDVGTDGDNWNETLDNGTVLDRNRNAAVLTNGVSAAHLTDVFQTYSVSVDGTGSNLTVMIVMDSTVGGFGGIGLDNLKLYGSVQALEGFEHWISGYGLSGTNAVKTANPDGDQYTNLEEYIAGLNPNVSDSFHIMNFTVGAGNAFEWNAISGRVYNIYWSRNLLDGFTLIESNVAVGAFSDAAHTNAPQGYYKITVELEP